MRITLLVHMIGGGLGLVSGAVALSAAKGATLHRKSGTLFVYAMLIMSLSGAGIAITRDIGTNAIGGFLAAYLVITALTTVRPPSPGSRWLDLGAMLVGLAIGLTSTTLGVESLIRGEAAGHDVPMPMLIFFGAVALLASAADIRVIRSGIQGQRRLARHLWRMCLALFIATGSFFLGQAPKLLPRTLHITPLLVVLALAPLLLMSYWLWRTRGGKMSQGLLHRSPRSSP